MKPDNFHDLLVQKKKNIRNENRTEQFAFHWLQDQLKTISFEKVISA